MLGRGGMGEVYRARDPRLKRDVAIKTISPALVTDAELVRRFEQEALAAASINHPNIVTVHDVGTIDGVTFVVSELIDGETLRTILDRGPLSIQTAVDYANQLAQGLAAAHEHGIIHRDLKPENILIGGDGRAKIVDFGLAKLASGSGNGDPDSETAVAETKPGVVMGTTGYMAPEQARGQQVDHRADLFNLGAIVYEMLTGRRAFTGATTSDVLAAILTTEPPLDQHQRPIPPALQQIIRHCLDKNRERRFQSARDISFALEAAVSPSGSIVVAPKPRRRVAWPLIAIATAVIASLITYAVMHRRASPILRFHQLTFRRGAIQWARFSPDGNTVVFGASWEGKPFEVFTARADSPESRALGLLDADIRSISSTGEMLVLLHPQPDVFYSRTGTLARVPLAGGMPREIVEHANEADWSPDGSQFALVVDDNTKSRLEYPAGTVLFDTTGWITDARISPDGQKIGFVHHPVRPDDGGEVDVVHLTKKVRVLSKGYVSVGGLVWRNGEILFTGAHAGRRALYRTTMDGETALIAETPGSLRLLDISKSGQLLVTEEQYSGVMNVGERRGGNRRDLAWLDGSTLRDISRDGDMILFDESAAGGGEKYGVYVRKTDGSPAVRIGEGVACSMSPDKRWAISFDPHKNPAPLVILPIGAGQPQQLESANLHHECGAWFPDSKRIAFLGVEKAGAPRIYVQELPNGVAKPISPEGTRIAPGGSVSPDGRFVAATNPSRKLTIYATDGSHAAEIPNVDPRARFGGWSSDSRFIYTAITEQQTILIDRVEVASGKSERWDTISADFSGMGGRASLKVTPDGNLIGYHFFRTLDTMYLVDGVR